MIHYTFYQKNPASHYIYIDLHIGQVAPGPLQLQLPAWRPGRYELGNFAKNIKRLEAFDSKGKSLPYIKRSKDLWEISVETAGDLKITYSYYAAELNAGSCYADISQIYVNPVNCCLYVPGRTREPHTVELKMPDNYRIACSLPAKGNTLSAVDFEELADSPFMASAGLQSDQYEVEGMTFHLHFNGECRPDFAKIKKDFSAFTRHLIAFWKDFPHHAYHFLFQVTPYKFYHGVEHHRNTVIAIGPGYAINTGPVYGDVLGVSCHELFHTWNVKAIRPVEMQPYDFSAENYARTGYVYEGFTTYYGDKLLLGSGVFSLAQYIETLEERLLKHFHNYGRYNLSVADSSYDTWLDGYVPGAPYRKTNIYDEGSLIALMLDVRILQATGNTRSLRDVCLLLYERFGKTGKGYSEQDIISLVNEVSGRDFSDFFNHYVYTAADYEAPLKEAFASLGFEMMREPSAQVHEHLYGFKVTDSGAYSRVSLVAPYSPAWKAGIFAGDEIIAVNRMVLKNNLAAWLHYFAADEEIVLTINTADQIRQLTLHKDHKGNTYFFTPRLRKQQEDSENYRAWLKF